MSTPYRAARFLFALFAFAWLGATLASDAVSGERALALRARPAGHRTGASSTPIQHVVVLVLENRTVDNLFAGMFGHWSGMNIANPHGSHPLREISLATRWDPDHTHEVGFVTEFEGGRQHGWGRENFACPKKHGCEPNPTALAYVDPTEVQPYVALAQNFVIADNVFQGNEGPSLPAHQYLIAAQSGGLASGDNAGYAIAENPHEKITRRGAQPLGPQPEGPRPGDSPDARTGCAGRTGTQFIDMTTPYPGIENKRQRACLDYSTIFDLLDSHLGNKSKNWRYYTSDYSIWNAPLWVRHLYRAYRNNTNNVVPGRDGQAFLRDLGAGDLSPVTFIMPCFKDSDHPLSYSRTGPLWTAYIANAIGASKFWSNTAIFVVWDDWGGWYDHVKTGHPANNPYGNPKDPNEWGFRVPLIALSPYSVNRGYVDHTPRSSSAILRFIESNFGLGSLGGDDSINDDLSSLFNFDRTPLPWIPVSTGSYHPSRNC